MRSFSVVPEELRDQLAIELIRGDQQFLVIVNEFFLDRSIKHALAERGTPRTMNRAISAAEPKFHVFSAFDASGCNSSRQRFGSLLSSHWFSGGPCVSALRSRPEDEPLRSYTLLGELTLDTPSVYKVALLIVAIRSARCIPQ
jgi:hypothetical protein